MRPLLRFDLTVFFPSIWNVFSMLSVRQCQKTWHRSLNLGVLPISVKLIVSR